MQLLDEWDESTFLELLLHHLVLLTKIESRTATFNFMWSIDLIKQCSHNSLGIGTSWRSKTLKQRYRSSPPSAYVLA